MKIFERVFVSIVLYLPNKSDMESNTTAIVAVGLNTANFH